MLIFNTLILNNNPKYIPPPSIIEAMGLSLAQTAVALAFLEASQMPTGPPFLTAASFI